MSQKFFAVCIFAVLFSAVAFAAQTEGLMKIYAVTTEGEGLVATLHLEIEPGNGKIWSAVTPLVGTSTQNAERTAVKVAQDLAGNAGAYDYKYTIDSPASVVDGPSAGAAMTLLAVSLLLDKPLSENVSLTGTIREDGSVGQVGGIFEKAREASKTGIKLFLIPRDEAVQTVKLPEGVKSINLIDYAPQNWGMKVVEVDNIDSALRLANSKIEDINAGSASSEVVPDFVPEKIHVDSDLGSFKLLVTNYISEAKQYTEEARNALSSTLLEDPEISHSLLDALNNAEQTLQTAEILNEQNYLYSAANYAFLARVNSVIVKEVSGNPKLIQQSSPDLDLRLYELKKELVNFSDDLDSNPPKSGIEWFASAQQRFTYAKTNVDRLTSQQTVVVGGAPEDELQQAFIRVHDYAYAVAWLDVAKDFYALSQEKDSHAKRPRDFSTSMDAPLAEVRDRLKEFPEGAVKNDIQRRADSAMAEKDANWFEASYFDSVSALALAEAEADMNGLDSNQLREKLEGKIRAVESEMAASNAKAGWAMLYLYHAKYYLASAEYYEKNNLAGSTAEDLRSGYGLALLAERILFASKEVNSVYSALPEAAQGNGNGGAAGQSPAPPIFTNIAIILFLLAFILVLATLLFGVANGGKGRKLPILQEMRNAKKKMKEADEAFLRGKIGAEAHAQFMEKYSAELSRLEAERKNKALHMLAVDDFTTGISAYNERLKDLRKHLKEGIITGEEFANKSKEYLAQIEGMKEALHSEIEATAKQGISDVRAGPAKARPAKPAKKKRGGRGIRGIAKAALGKDKKRGKNRANMT